MSNLECEPSLEDKVIEYLRQSNSNCSQKSRSGFDEHSQLDNDSKEFLALQGLRGFQEILSQGERTKSAFNDIIPAGHSTGHVHSSHGDEMRVVDADTLSLLLQNRLLLQHQDTELQVPVKTVKNTFINFQEKHVRDAERRARTESADAVLENNIGCADFGSMRRNMHHNNFAESAARMTNDHLSFQNMSHNAYSLSRLKLQQAQSMRPDYPLRNPDPIYQHHQPPGVNGGVQPNTINQSHNGATDGTPTPGMLYSHMQHPYMGFAPGLLPYPAHQYPLSQHARYEAPAEVGPIAPVPATIAAAALIGLPHGIPQDFPRSALLANVGSHVDPHVLAAKSQPYLNNTTMFPAAPGALPGGMPSGMLSGSPTQGVPAAPSLFAPLQTQNQLNDVPAAVVQKQPVAVATDPVPTMTDLMPNVAEAHFGKAQCAQSFTQNDSILDDLLAGSYAVPFGLGTSIGEVPHNQQLNFFPTRAAPINSPAQLSFDNQLTAFSADHQATKREFSSAVPSPDTLGNYNGFQVHELQKFSDEVVPQESCYKPPIGIVSAHSTSVLPAHQAELLHRGSVEIALNGIVCPDNIDITNHSRSGDLFLEGTHPGVDAHIADPFLPGRHCSLSRVLQEANVSAHEFAAVASVSFNSGGDASSGSELNRFAGFKHESTLSGVGVDSAVNKSELNEQKHLTSHSSFEATPKKSERRRCDEGVSPERCDGGLSPDSFRSASTVDSPNATRGVVKRTTADVMNDLSVVEDRLKKATLVRHNFAGDRPCLDNSVDYVNTIVSLDKFRLLPVDDFPCVRSEKFTVMLRNIPNKYSLSMLKSVLNDEFKGLYDFCYLPIDFWNKCNVGYAFINFVHPLITEQFRLRFRGFKLTAFKSNKVCVVSHGRVQGLRENIEHYRNSAVLSNDIIPEYKPAIFDREGNVVAFPDADGPLPQVKPRLQKSGRSSGPKQSSSGEAM